MRAVFFLEEGDESSTFLFICLFLWSIVFALISGYVADDRYCKRLQQVGALFKIRLTDITSIIPVNGFNALHL